MAELLDRAHTWSRSSSTRTSTRGSSLARGRRSSAAHTLATIWLTLSSTDDFGRTADRQPCSAGASRRSCSGPSVLTAGAAVGVVSLAHGRADARPASFVCVALACRPVPEERRGRLVANPSIRTRVCAWAACPRRWSWPSSGCCRWSPECWDASAPGRSSLPPHPRTRSGLPSRLWTGPTSSAGSLPRAPRRTARR